MFPIHKAAGLTVPGRSIISTGTIPVEQKSVDWLSMGAAGSFGIALLRDFFIPQELYQSEPCSGGST